MTVFLAGRLRVGPMARRAAAVILLAAPMLAAGQARSIASEPPNLGKVRLEVEAYHDCQGTHGCYARDLDQRTAVAATDLRLAVSRRRGGGKPALVLDIDETSVSNYAELLRSDFAYSAKDWDRWVEQADAPAIPGTLRLYRAARRLGVAVFFITGRPDSERAATEENLRRDGYTHWAGLAMRSAAEAKWPTEAYKAAERAKIQAKGYRIVVNVGDQMSDLEGQPAAEFSVKLPDPFYYIP